MRRGRETQRCASRSVHSTDRAGQGQLQQPDGPSSVGRRTQHHDACRDGENDAVPGREGRKPLGESFGGPSRQHPGRRLGHQLVDLHPRHPRGLGRLEHARLDGRRYDSVLQEGYFPSETNTHRSRPLTFPSGKRITAKAHTKRTAKMAPYTSLTGRGVRHSSRTR